jgi:hypothetical protein
MKHIIFDFPSGDSITLDTEKVPPRTEKDTLIIVHTAYKCARRAADEAGADGPTEWAREMRQWDLQCLAEQLGREPDDYEVRLFAVHFRDEYRSIS